MENNKTLKLPVVEDVINSFVDQGVIIINVKLSTSREIKYDYNPHHFEEFSILKDVFTINDNKDTTAEVIYNIT